MTAASALVAMLGGSQAPIENAEAATIGLHHARSRQARQDRCLLAARQVGASLAAVRPYQFVAEQPQAGQPPPVQPVRLEGGAQRPDDAADGVAGVQERK